MSITDNLNTVFGITETRTEESLPAEVGEISTQLQAANKMADIALARQTIIDLITKSSDLLDECITLAKESQSPRAAEVAANLIKTTSDVAKDLLTLHEEKGGRVSAKSVTEVTQATQNNTYYLSTHDLQAMLKTAEQSIEGEIVEDGESK